jgi:hypothetical protein
MDPSTTLRPSVLRDDLDGRVAALSLESRNPGTEIRGNPGTDGTFSVQHVRNERKLACAESPRLNTPSACRRPLFPYP